MISIHNNTPSLVGQRNLGRTQKSLQGSLEKLSSGLRINKSADDSAGLALATDMKVDLRSLTQAKRNANDAVSILQTVDSVMGQQSDIMTRMRELAVQANNDTLTDGQKDAINAEFGQLQTEFDDIVSDTKYNGNALLDGSLSADIQVGIESTDTLTIAVDDMSGATLGIDSGTIELSAASGDAGAAIDAIDDAFETLLTERSKVGAMQNRLDVKIENLSSTFVNTEAARSRIEDVDIASEMASFTKSQVLSQAGTSMLAQANSLPQAALGLLG